MKTPTPMTKSPRAVAQEALRSAQESLPPYSAVTSRKDYTQHQLFALVALKTFLKTDYRGVVAFLNDSAQFAPVLLAAALGLSWDRVLADAAFDSEAHHQFARASLGIRSSVIPINARGSTTTPSGKYRRQMATRFRPRPEGSRHKRV